MSTKTGTSSTPTTTAAKSGGRLPSFTCVISVARASANLSAPDSQQQWAVLARELKALPPKLMMERLGSWKVSFEGMAHPERFSELTVDAPKFTGFIVREDVLTFKSLTLTIRCKAPDRPTTAALEDLLQSCHPRLELGHEDARNDSDREIFVFDITNFESPEIKLAD